MSETPDPAAFAALLCDWCLEVRPGQQVLVRSSTEATPLLLALQAAILDREAWPLLRVELPGEAAGWYGHARDAQLDGFPPLALAEMASADARLVIQAPQDTRALAGVDPARIARAARGQAPVREAGMQIRWCGSIWPTAALAADAGLPLADYAAFLERALFLDQPDPIAAWQALSARQAALVERLTPAREIRIEADHTDLTLRVDGRTWVNSDGRRNMPSGEVFTGPLEDSANGRIRFGVPSSPRGVEVSGVELVFRDGEVVEATAEVGEDYLRAALATDPGAVRLGELGIGTNLGIDRPTGTILLDEKIGGTVHLAVGRSYPETGGTNVSAVHWDLICDLRESGRLSADGATIIENGTLPGSATDALN